MKKLFALLLTGLLVSQSLIPALALTEQSYDFAGENELVSKNYPLARKAAGEGIVLLENKNSALPLASDASVSLFGIGQIDYVAGGTGSGIINTEYKVNFLDGMLDAEENGKLTVDKATAKVYEDIYAAWQQAVADAAAAGTSKPALDEYALTDADVSTARASSDTAIYFIRRIQGEGSDRKAAAGDYYISETEAANLAKLDAANFDNFIIVINAGTAVDTSFFGEYETADSLIMAWLPGVEGGLALADVVTGDVNPSGKLTDTFLKSYDYYPSAETFAQGQSFVNYEEDIYNGYRYFETFDPEYTMVNYEFGYGLSYTTFEMSADTVTNDGENINVSVKVTNTGDVAGKEVVQVYFSAPQGLLGKPAKELAGYAKTKLLGAGESETVIVSFPVSDMSSFDDLGKTGYKSAYVLEAGDYNIYIGNSVKNAGTRGVKGTYTVSETTVTEQLTSLLAPNTLEKRLIAREKDDGSITAEYERFSVTTEADGSYKLDPEAAVTTIDAENYTAGTDGLEIPVLPEQDNLKYVKGLTEGQYISFDVSNEASAMYTVSLKLSNGTAAAVSPSFNIYLNDALVCENISVASTGSGTTDGSFVFSETEFGLLIFDAGKSTVKIESANDGVLDIDSIVFRPVNDLPTIYADKANVIEAETFCNSYNVAGSMGITTETAFGETLVAKMQGVGNYIEYRFMVEKAGTYSFLFNYAATSNQTTPYAIYVNGVNQEVSYTLAKTSPEGSTSADGNTYYNTCADAAAPFNIKLPEGFVTLRIQTVGGSPNINRFTLTKTFELPEGYTLISGDEDTVVEAENCSAKSDGIWAGTKTVNGVSVTALNAIKASTGTKYIEYKLYFEKAGKYGVVFSHASTAAGSDHFNFYANGNKITVDSYTFPKTTPEGVTSASDSTAFYHTYADSDPIIMEFPEGAVVFKLETADNSNKPNLNSYTFKPVVGYEAEAPAGYDIISDTEPTVIQAESFDANYNAQTQAMNKKTLTQGDFSGEIIMENIKSGGSYLEYNVWFKYGGTYKVTYNYAATKEYTNPFEIYIDGEKLTRADSYTLPKTSLDGVTSSDAYNFYFIFQNSDAISYTFPQGSAVLRISAENGVGASVDMPNLNYITLECVEADIPEITVPDTGSGDNTTGDESTDEETEPTVPADRLPGYTEAAEGAEIIMYEDWYNGEATLEEFVSQMTNLELIRLAGGHPPVNGCSSSMGRLYKYHIPAVSTGDGGAGIRTGADAMTTWWPCSTMLACTWNLDLIHEVGNGVGAEGARLRWDTWLAPGMNIHRNPLCGRNFEYYSEDPLISGNCAAEITIGARENGMHTVSKHFAVNNKETGRSISDSRISERALREIYLKGFEILVKKADPRYIMTSYNLINGTEAAESYDLQTAILRDEWGFDGITMTDWNNTNSRPAKEIKAGSNIRKPYGEINELVSDLAEGNITREDLKKNAMQLLPVLSDSMSFTRMMNIHEVDRSGDTYISALDYNRVNDDHFGLVLEDYTKSDGTVFKAGKYFEQHSWTPGLYYISGGAVGMNLVKGVSNTSIDFEDKLTFIEFVINVKEAGNYDLELFVPSSNKQVEIYLDGENIGTAVSGTASKNEIVRRTSAVPMKLSQGEHAIKLSGASVVERICISPNYDKEVVNVDCKIFTTPNSEWGLTYESANGEMGAYTHIAPDPDDVHNNMRTDHWGLAIDETAYKYLVFCYRTNYNGDIVASGMRSGQTTGDNNKYTFKADKLNEWTTSIIELQGTGDDTMFRQMHLSVFGNENTHANALENELYFDLYHFGFFKTAEDAAAFCSQHAVKPVSGRIFLERDAELGYYDDVIKGYSSYAVITLKDSDGNIVARTGEHRLGTAYDDEKGLAISYSFEVADGDYTLTVQKPGYIPETVNVTVKDGKAELNDIVLVAGDITDSYENLIGDGVVDIDDFVRILRAFAEDSSEKLRMFTDINEDGTVNVSDLALVKKGASVR